MSTLRMMKARATATATSSDAGQEHVRSTAALKVRKPQIPEGGDERAGSGATLGGFREMDRPLLSPAADGEVREQP